MSLPLPLLSVPTQRARIAFLRVVYDAGWNWCSHTPVYAEKCMDEGYENYDWVYMNEYADIRFGQDGLINAVRSGGQPFALLNSPAHFISYARPVWTAAHDDYDENDWDGDFGPEGAA